MADPAAIAKVEQVFAYRFRDRVMLNPVFLAATRADKEQGETHDGNRSLSQLGTSVIEWVVIQKSILNDEQRSMRPFTSEFLAYSNQRTRPNFRAGSNIKIHVQPFVTCLVSAISYNVALVSTIGQLPAC